ncbi:MAG: hypothetical protein ACPG06_03790 [Alphaproteobacteria bacterium]
MDDEAMKRMEQALGEPVLADYPEEFRRTKRNLLAVAVVVVFLALGGATVENIQAMGLQVVGLSEWWMLVAVLSVLVYLFIQFIWQFSNYLMQSRIRLTGPVKKVLQTVSFGGDVSDSALDPRQSTLYYWWLSQLKVHEKLAPEKLEETLDAIHALMEGAEYSEFSDIKAVAPNLQSEVNNLRDCLQSVQRTFEDARVPVTLERFDKWFSNFRWSQRWRMYLLDFLFPIFVSGVAAGALVHRIY